MAGTDKPDADAEQMLKVQQGDLEAFETLVDRYKRPIFNLIYRMLRDPDEAEDITQKVFVQAYKASERYRPTAQFSTWIFTIARNLSSMRFADDPENRAWSPLMAPSIPMGSPCDWNLRMFELVPPAKCLNTMNSWIAWSEPLPNCRKTSGLPSYCVGRRNFL